MNITTRERLSELIHTLHDICDALIPQLDAPDVKGLEYEVESAHSMLALLGELQVIIATHAQVRACNIEPGEN
jgi:hypothetical protein